MAFHINLKDSKKEASESNTSFPDMYDFLLQIDHDDGQASLLATLFNSIKLNLDLTCPICLVNILN